MNFKILWQASLIGLTAIMPVSPVFAETAETERLVGIVISYGKCMDTAPGIFANDEEALQAFRTFLPAAMRHVKTSLALELVDRKKNSKADSLVVMSELIGNDALAGYMLGAFIAVDQNNLAYKEEKDRLEKKFGDWREASKVLWEAGGCPAIYDALRKN